MYNTHPGIDLVSEYVHVFGWPAILGVLWTFRGRIDEFINKIDQIAEKTEKASQITGATLAEVNIIKTNHLTHVEENIGKLAETQEKTITVLASIDRGIAVLVDRKQI